MQSLNISHLKQRPCFLADLHIHSRYSRATSPEMHPAAINRVAKEKGIQVMATGDITHPQYLKELKNELEPAEEGLFVCKDDSKGTRFLLTAEVSNIFSQGGKGRRIHTLILMPSLKAAEMLQAQLAKLGNITSDGRPMLGFSVKQLVRIVMNISEDCMVIPAHAWTPWFSVFGSKSGFDSIEECFEEESGHIYALETGLSSDPLMNRRLSTLDKYTLISNSDAHSPAKLGREANIFSCPMTYQDIIKAIKQPAHGLEGTIEFFPEEGKYHYDGHRDCGVLLSPEQTRKLNGICPVCHRPLTLGVAYRVEELADRTEETAREILRLFHFDTKIRPYISLVPLQELLAEAMQMGEGSARVRKEYQRLVQMGGSEMDILLWKDEKELEAFLPEAVLRGIQNMRAGMVQIRPGYDGVYGEVRLLSEIKDTVEPKGAEPFQQRLF